MEGDRKIGEVIYRVIRDGYRLWRIRKLNDFYSHWVETDSGRPRHWKSKGAAVAWLDRLEADHG